MYTAILPFKVGDVNKAKAYFVSCDTIAWPASDSSKTYGLYYASMAVLRRRQMASRADNGFR